MKHLVYWYFKSAYFFQSLPVRTGIAIAGFFTGQMPFLLPKRQGCVRGQHGRGQGQGHKILSSRSRPVLDDPIPAKRLCHRATGRSWVLSI